MLDQVEIFFEFEIPDYLDDLIRENSIPQYNSKTNPLNQGGLAPKIVDPDTPGRSYQIPADIWLDWIEEYAMNARKLK